MTVDRRCLIIVAIVTGLASANAHAVEAIDIGSRRELFVDRYLIERLEGASLRLHEPEPAETALRFDAPHEGVFAGYVTVIKDADAYTLADCDPIVGDDLDRPVTWKRNTNVAGIARTPVRLRVTLRDADLFSIQFR